MKILLLGGTGAMGADLVKILAQNGENASVTSRSTRQYEYDNVKYIQGNAHDNVFLKKILDEKYDAIVDFMVYNTEEFKERRELLLDATDQYVFLSSSRVYADSTDPITEDSPRLLDVTSDVEYLKTDEYALTKARQENLLRESGKMNWTIIRPYITYSSQRLQLGVYEKELWLYRALHERTIVFPRAIAEKYTTMTLGEDVARGISKLVGNKKAMGQAFHITTGETIKWEDVLLTYKKVFQDVIGHEIQIRYTDDIKPIYESMGNKYQIIYDRFFNRKFNNKKYIHAAGMHEFVDPKTGLERCLREFLKNPEFRNVSYSSLAYMDRLTKDRAGLSEIPGIGQKGKYLLKRYMPIGVIRRLRAVLKK